MASETGKGGTGFSFGDHSSGGGSGRGGGRDGGRGGGRDGGRGGDRKDRSESGPGYRILGELSVLEKAISKTDFAAQRRPLEEIVKGLKPLRLKSVEDLDLNTRGKLITTLARVARQPKPPPAPAAPPFDPSAQSASTQTPPTQVVDEVGISEGSPAETVEHAEAVEATAHEEASAATEPAPPPPEPVEDKAQSYAEVLYRVGLIWKVVGESDRAENAFAASGKTLDPADLARMEAPVERAPARRDVREGRSDPRRERGARPERGERPTGDRERFSREREALPPLPEGADWTEMAAALEARKRTRDAARLHEKHQSFAEAARLFEAGGDMKSALRNALGAKDMDASRRLMATMTPEESQAVLEKSEAYELLMELYVAKGQFDQVARLYERARQFDQAALAWERAGKLTPARKAFERARDLVNVERVRGLEVQKLIERGDRLGAAVILAQAGKRSEAGEVLKALPAPKAFRFLQKVKLEEEAQALAQAELAKAEEEKKPSSKARWLELLGNVAGAAEAWEQADRKDKAYPLYAQLKLPAKAAGLAEAAGHREKAIALYREAGDSESAARVEATPVSEPPPPPASDAEQAAAAAEDLAAEAVPTEQDSQ